VLDPSSRSPASSAQAKAEPASRREAWPVGTKREFAADAPARVGQRRRGETHSRWLVRQAADPLGARRHVPGRDAVAFRCCSHESGSRPTPGPMRRARLASTKEAAMRWLERYRVWLRSPLSRPRPCLFEIHLAELVMARGRPVSTLAAVTRVPVLGSPHIEDGRRRRALDPMPVQGGWARGTGRSCRGRPRPRGLETFA
jgi:hypothetical protein